MFLRGLEGWHIVIIVALVALLFGAKRMPDAARSVGQSLRIFKSEMKAASAEGKNEAAHGADPAAHPAAVIANAETQVTAPAPAPASVINGEPVPVSRAEPSGR
jgi:sec-independent protein translocase protein TatA